LKWQSSGALKFTLTGEKARIPVVDDLVYFVLNFVSKYGVL